MPRFEFTSPGAAFASEMAKVLAERKAQERQQLLDSLTMNADARAQQQLELDRKTTDSNIKHQQYMDRLSKYKAILEQMDAGEPVPDKNRDLFEEFGGTKEIQTPIPPPAAVGSIKDETGAEVQKAPDFISESTAAPQALPPQLVVRGTAEQRELARRRQGLLDLVESMKVSKDPNIQQNAAALERIAQAGGGVVDPKEVMGLISSNVPVYVFDQDNGRFATADGKPVEGNQVPANAKILVRTRPPASAYNLMPKVVGHTDEGYNIMADRTGNRWVDTSVPPAAPARMDNPLGVPRQTIENYNMVIQTIDVDPDTGKVNPADLIVLRRAAGSIIHSSKVSPLVRDIATTYILNPTAAEERVRSLGQMSQSDKDQLRELIANLTGDPTLDKIYRANAVKLTGNK